MLRANQRQPGSSTMFVSMKPRALEVPGEVVDHHGRDGDAAGEVDRIDGACRTAGGDRVIGSGLAGLRHVGRGRGRGGAAPPAACPAGGRHILDPRDRHAPRSHRPRPQHRRLHRRRHLDRERHPGLPLARLALDAPQADPVPGLPDERRGAARGLAAQVRDRRPRPRRRAEPRPSGARRPRRGGPDAGGDHPEHRRPAPGLRHSAGPDRRAARQRHLRRLPLLRPAP